MSGSDSAVWCWALGPEYIRNRSERQGPAVSEFCAAQDLIEYYRCRNVAYFPGAKSYSSETFAPLGQCQKVMAEVDHMSEDGRARASEVSRLSRRIPSLAGGIIDDFSSAAARGEAARQEDAAATGGKGVARAKRFEFARNTEQLAANLKSANPSLPLYAVCYTMHFDVDMSAAMPFVDKVSLWVWHLRDLPQLAAHVAKAIALYRKPIHLGLYVYDYAADDPKWNERDWPERVRIRVLPMDLMRFQFERAGQFLKDGRIEGIHILGSYLRDELKTEQARYAADFCRSL